MDFVQLEHFLAVADEGSFTRAAERVYRTQSAISQSIKKLEDSVGAALFVREWPDLRLTEAGKLLAAHARRIVQMRDEAIRSLEDLRRMVVGSVSVVASEAAAVYLLPGPLRVYLQQYPEIRVGIYRSVLDEIPRRVLDREVEVGFVKEAGLFQDLTCVQVHTDKMVLIGSPAHPLSQRATVRLADLSSEHFVLHHQCAATTQTILQLFDRCGGRCNVAAELWSFENVKQFVREGVGFAIVPGICVRQEVADGTLVALPVPELDIPRTTRLIYRDGHQLSDAARAFVGTVCGFNWIAHASSPKGSSLEARGV